MAAMTNVRFSLTHISQIFEEHSKNWVRSFRLIWTAAPKLSGLWASLLIAQGFIPGLLVYLTKVVVDSLVVAVNSQGDWGKIRPAIFLIATIGFVMLVSDVLQSLSEIVRTAQADIIQDHIKSLVHKKSEALDMSHFESSEYHDRLEQATSDGASRPLSLLESIGSTIQTTISLAVMAGLLIQYSVWLPIVLVLTTIPAFAIILRFDREYHKWWKGTTGERRWIQYFDVMLTHSRAVAEIKAFTLSSHFQTRYQDLRKRLRTDKLDQTRRLGVAKLVTGVFSLFIMAAATVWMGWRSLYGSLTLGDLALFYQAFSRGQGLMRTLLGSVGQMIKNSLFVSVLFEFLDLESRIHDPESPVATPGNLNEGIRVSNVTFRYPGTDRFVFRDVSLFLPAGKTVAIVGENGSGKTTLLKLICRFYDPESGRIEFDGVDIRKFSINGLLSLITITFQMPLNYHATVSESIAMGDLQMSASTDEIKSAARDAGADEFISRLPDQYDTLLGKVHANGAELSGGEWQRLALARAYFRKAPIILLDEPTSFMDSWSETDWFRRFRSLAEGRTALVITHRFTIAMRADIIMVMDKGQIVEQGTHRELLELSEKYAKSWREQMRVAGESENGFGSHDHHSDKINEV